jgi:hypothetical protein
MDSNIEATINELYESIDYSDDIVDTNPIVSKVDSTSDLDVSWIEDESKLHKISENYFREPMDSIDMYFIYINRNNYIEKILYEKQALELSDNNYSVLKKEKLLHIIQTRKIKTAFSKYKLVDVLSYAVDLEPELIQSYSKNDNIESTSESFFKVLSILNDVQIQPSIFIFHGVNAIYFIFQEVENNSRHTLKSILKSSTSENKIGSTKKVRIQLNSVDKPTSKNNKGTRKNKRDISSETNKTI